MRKHLTKAERVSRKKAEAGMRRETRVTLRVPTWLTAEARSVWRDLRRRSKGLELLDNVDSEMLGIYCDTVAKYRAASKALTAVDEDGAPVATDEMVKSALSWARLAASYAEKLGLTPNARARLAKKRAEDKPKDELEELLDDVQDYMDQQ